VWQYGQNPTLVHTADVFDFTTRVIIDHVFVGEAGLHFRANRPKWHVQQNYRKMVETFFSR
jgi:hypothetical protein